MTFENLTRRGFLATVAGAALALLSCNALAQSAEDLRATGAAGERWDGCSSTRPTERNRWLFAGRPPSC